MMLLRSTKWWTAPLLRIADPAVADASVARDAGPFACSVPLEPRLFSSCFGCAATDKSPTPSSKTSQYPSCLQHTSISKVRTSRGEHSCCGFSNKNDNPCKNEGFVLSHSQEIDPPINIQNRARFIQNGTEKQSCQMGNNFTQSSAHYPRQLSIGSSQISQASTNFLIGNHRPLYESKILSRTIKTVACLLGKEDHSRRALDMTETADNSSNEGEGELEAEEVEWIHPSERHDTILESDPELKSLLRELASDFGRAEQTADGGKEGEGTLQEDAKDKMKSVEGDEAFEPVHSEKGKPMADKRFVFSIDDLVSILREENAQDMCVINIPKEKQYVDYFVVVTGRSPRHIRAMSLHINQQYKARKTKRDPFVLVEGEQTEDWMCIDFGNIVIHLMSEETREFYELEKLWTLGPEYDDQLQRMRQYDEKMRDAVTIETEIKTSQEQEQEESDQPTITIAR